MIHPRTLADRKAAMLGVGVRYTDCSRAVPPASEVVTAQGTRPAANGSPAGRGGEAIFPVCATPAGTTAANKEE